jgi:hypothetical protein
MISHRSLPFVIAAVSFASACNVEIHTDGHTASEDSGTRDAAQNADGGVSAEDASTSVPDSSTLLDAATSWVDATPDELGPSGCTTEKLDLLFVIDNSKSMTEEQAKLSAQLPKLVKILTSGDYDGDGVQDFEPVSDLHLGVISSDMGAAGVPGVPTCGKNNAMGDDGVLISTSRSLSCNGFALSSTRYQAFTPGTTQASDQLAADFACLASLGTDGCGFEQPLEAMYKALAPDSETFAKGTGGHGDESNAGFLRSDAVLAVILVSDEEDCSITDQGVDLYIRDLNSPNVLLPNSSKRIGLNLRCAYKADDASLIHPVTRYIDGLKQLKPDNPERVIFAGIVGIPLAAEGKPLNEVLADPGMKFVPDPNSQGAGDPANDLTTPVPACVSLTGDTVVTNAFPAARVVKTAQGFGRNGVVRSICAEDYSPAVEAIIERVVRVASCEVEPQ